MAVATVVHYVTNTQAADLRGGQIIKYYRKANLQEILYTELRLSTWESCKP